MYTMSDNVITPITAARGRRRTAARTISTARLTSAPLPALADSWRTALEGANKSAKTIQAYMRTATQFTLWLRDHGHRLGADDIEAAHVRQFIADERERTSAISAWVHFSNLRIWFNWIIREGDRTLDSPVRKEDAPKFPKKVKKYLTEDEQRRLLRTCQGSDFADRRDTAIIRILIDNGMRVSGLAGLRLDNVDLKGRGLTIVLKGGDELVAPIGARTCTAIDRYLRIRGAHIHAEASPWLWLGMRGHDISRLTSRGIRSMLARRGKQAGVENVHPHRFRGTAAHQLLKAGANDSDVQHIMGWKTRTMVDYYAGDLARERARETHARLSPGDRV